MALSGLALREKLKERVHRETVRERWENGWKQGDSNLERFLGEVKWVCRTLSPHSVRTTAPPCSTAPEMRGSSCGTRHQ